jgi:hypothetical protein
LSINSVTENVFSCNRQEHALQLAAKGFALLPLKPKGKKPYWPLIPIVNGKYSWAVYRKKPPSAADIKAWFEYDPDVNIGIITGPSSMGGLYVLDLDKKPPASFGPLPPTVIVKSGRPNGWHYYFTCNKELKTVPLGPKGSLGCLQGVGHYMAAAGSIHHSGAVYEYADGLSLEQIEIAPLPEWLADGRKRNKYIPNCKEQIINSEASRPPAPNNCIIQSGINTPFQNRHRNKKNIVSMRTLSFPDLEGLNERPEIAFKLMAICGRQVNKIGKAFSCPLPGHVEENPSAALYQEAGRPIILNDFHFEKHETGRFSWPLVDVYASVVVGKPLKLRKGERAIWWLRALDEMGELNLPGLVRRELPQEAKQAVRIAYDGFCYLLRLRQLYEPSQAAPFNRTFAAKWCNTDTDTIRRGMSWLLSRGYLTIASRGRPNHAEGGPALTFFAIGMPDERRDRK